MIKNNSVKRLKGEVVRFSAEDRVELSGVFYRAPGAGKTAIFVHGVGSNFYAHDFIFNLAWRYVGAGVNFLSFNNRGAEYFSYLRRADGKFLKLGGVAYERFSESPRDIRTAIDFSGSDEVVLIGHSYGCNKVAYYAGTTGDARVRKVVLLAPCDVVKSNEMILGDGYAPALAAARKLIAAGRSEEILPSPRFPMTFTARRLVEDWTPDSSADFFRYRTSGYISPTIAKITVPIEIYVGDKDTTALLGTGRENYEQFWQNNKPATKIKYIPGGDHNFIGAENVLADMIDD